MKSKHSSGETNRTVPETIPVSEIRVSREAIAAAEKVLGRSLRSSVPDLSPEEQRPKG